MRYLFLPQCLCFGMDADAEDLEEREGRRTVTSTVERERCIYLEHNRGKKHAVKNLECIQWIITQLAKNVTSEC